mmetsp:Transcript_41034/g.98930  ORF Transcript_41034/g.98930 Transcript_41034/m.98930 type:complete len:100 (+) Transcript_41034:1365-1664(+)
MWPETNPKHHRTNNNSKTEICFRIQTPVGCKTELASFENESIPYTRQIRFKWLASVAQWKADARNNCLLETPPVRPINMLRNSQSRATNGQEQCDGFPL